MKKLFIAAAALLLCAAASGRTFDMKILPERAQNFLVSTFPSHTIKYIESEASTYQRQTYSVKFTDGCEVDFDKEGNWRKIDCGDTPVPLSVIPDDIQSYVAMNNNQATFVTEIECRRNCYEVELNNGQEYVLNRKGMPTCSKCGMAADTTRAQRVMSRDSLRLQKMKMHAEHQTADND